MAAVAWPIYTFFPPAFRSTYVVEVKEISGGDKQNLKSTYSCFCSASHLLGESSVGTWVLKVWRDKKCLCEKGGVQSHLLLVLMLPANPMMSLSKLAQIAIRAEKDLVENGLIL